MVILESESGEIILNTFEQTRDLVVIITVSLCLNIKGGGFPVVAMARCGSFC